MMWVIFTAFCNLPLSWCSPPLLPKHLVIPWVSDSWLPPWWQFPIYLIIREIQEIRIGFHVPVLDGEIITLINHRQWCLGDAAKCLVTIVHANVVRLVESAEHIYLRKLGDTCQYNKLQISVSCLENTIETLWTAPSFLGNSIPK